MVLAVLLSNADEHAAALVDGQWLQQNVCFSPKARALMHIRHPFTVHSGEIVTVCTCMPQD